jgi:hypothetical protein
MKSSWLVLASVLLFVPGWARAQQPAAPPSNLEAGGLRPPEAIDPAQPDPNQAPEQTPEKELEQADREDAGRGLEWVWLNAEIGAAHLGLSTFKANDLVDTELVKTTQTGLVFGAGAGFRLLFFTVGARFRLGWFGDWRLWTLGAEGGLRIPMGRLEPYFMLGAGYAALGSFSSTAPISSKADVKGFNARAGFGIDYYLSNTFSVGGNLSGDLLVLARSEVAGASESTAGNEATVYAKDGSSIGAGATLTAVVGLHF